MVTEQREVENKGIGEIRQWENQRDGLLHNGGMSATGLGYFLKPLHWCGQGFVELRHSEGFSLFLRMLGLIQQCAGMALCGAKGSLSETVIKSPDRQHSKVYTVTTALMGLCSFFSEILIPRLRPLFPAGFSYPNGGVVYTSMPALTLHRENKKNFKMSMILKSNSSLKHILQQHCQHPLLLQQFMAFRLQPSLDFLITFCLFIWAVHVCYGAHLVIEDNLQKLVLSWNHVGPRD